MAHPLTPTANPALTLPRLKRIRRWHLAHKADHPLEYELWDFVMMVWVMGWVGWLPAFVLELPLAYPLCLLGMVTPQLYVRWRARAHVSGRLRCDWLELTH